MAKMTKSQARRLLQGISSKSFKLISRPPAGMSKLVFTIKDFEAIQKILDRAHNRLK
jgi:hypothetical protein